MKKRRVGRGGKRGTFSGHGSKGQKARAGHKIRPAEKDIILKIPKRRGLKHKPVSPRNFILTLAQLEKMAETNAVDKKFFIEKGLIKRMSQPVKVLNGGEIKKALHLTGLKVSKTAQAKIEKAGGSVK